MPELRSWSVGLVYRTADGLFHKEGWNGRAGSLGLALRAARRDALAGRFGRSFSGISRVGSSAELYHALAGAGSPPSAVDPSLSVGTLRGIVEAGGEAFDELVDEEPSRHPVASAAMGSTEWWRFPSAFGPGTWVGVELGRCAATDAVRAREAAQFVGEAVAHQGSLYPVTAVALPFMVELLEQPPVACRDELRAWCGVIVRSAMDGSQHAAVSDGFFRLVARIGRSWPFGAGELEQSIVRELTSGEQVPAQIEALAARLARQEIPV